MKRNVCAMVLVAVSGSAALAQQFTIAVLPDTQFYSEQASRFPQFLDQTQWIVANKARNNIVFVSHLGDIVQNGSVLAEWQRADQAMDVLDGVVPYAALPGNHDYAITGVKSSGSANYNAFFGPARHAAIPGYQGSSADGENHAHTFTAGGYTFLHLAMEWQPDGASKAWAQGRIDANPGLPTIISTHEYLQDWDSGGLGAGRSSAGLDLWNTFIRVNPQVFLVMNGHFHRGPNGADGELHTISLNNAGLPVVEMLSDFQAYPNGGSGWMRLVTFDIRNHALRVRTFSPTLDQYQQDFNSEFTLPFDFRKRFEAGVSGNAVPEVAFREGENAYAGTLDTQLSGLTPGTSAGASTSISVDANDGGLPTQGLVRFEDVFGTAAGQADPALGVAAARLRLVVINEGSGMRFHRQLADWTEASTWNSLTAGVSADGAEALGAPDVTVGRNDVNANIGRFTFDFDVTRSLRAWNEGEANRGWALLPNTGGTNGVDFQTSDFGTVSGRPQLVITTADRPTIDLIFRQGVDGYAGGSDFEVAQAAPDEAFPSEIALSIDADDPNGSGNDRQGVVRFDDIFGSGLGQIPAAATIVSATLELNVVDPGSGFTLHRLLTSVAPTATWNSVSGGLGADDSEGAIFIEAQAGADAAAAAVQAGVLRLDVTQTLRDWAAGPVPNHGWVLRPFGAGSNGLDVASSDHPDVNLRPRLTVRVTCPADIDGVPGVDLGDFFAFFAAFDAEGPAADIDRVNGVDLADFFAFFAGYDAGC